MASPKRPQTAYGYSMPSQASPSYPQYNLGVGLPGTVAPVAPQGSPNQLEALLRAIGLPATTPPMQPVPPQMPFGGGMGEPPMPLSGNPQDRLMPPGFVAQPVPMSPMPPRGGPVQSLPPMPPRLPEGRPIGGVPPYMPNPMESGYYTNPNQPPSGETVPPQSQYGVPTSSDGKWLFNNGQWMPNSTAKTFPMPESRPEEVFPGPGQQTQGKGLDVQKLMDALRAMQGRRQGQGLPTQAPFVPDYMLPINQNTAAIDPNMPISDEQRKRNLEALMGGTPRMPQGREGTPRVGPSPTMRGSGMGLEGILQGIEASRRSSR